MTSYMDSVPTSGSRKEPVVPRATGSVRGIIVLHVQWLFEMVKLYGTPYSKGKVSNANSQCELLRRLIEYERLSGTNYRQKCKL